MPDHDASRKMVCAICWNRGGRKADRVILTGSKEERGIRENVDSLYSTLDIQSPQGTCINCRLRLTEWTSGKPNPRKLLITTGVQLGKMTREVGDQKCRCHMCWLAWLNGGAWNRVRKQFAEERKEVKEVEVLEAMEPLRRCNNCFVPISRGHPHNSVSCHSTTSMLSNLKDAIPLETRTQLALDTIKELASGSGDSNLQVQSFKGGRPTTITFGAKEESGSGSSFLTLEDVKKMQLKHNFSISQMRGSLADIRNVFGFNSVEPYIRDSMSAEKAALRSFFKQDMVTFFKKVKDHDNEYTIEEEPMVYCCNLEGLLLHLAKERKMNPAELLKLIGFDRGQGHTQLTLQQYLESDLLRGEQENGKRNIREQGLAGKGKAAFGVNNLIILAISPVKSEDYINIEVFLEKVKLKVCPKFCGDLKVFNAITGIQTGTATFPCYGCEVRRDPTTGRWEGVPAKLRTYNGNMAWHQGGLANGGEALGEEGDARGQELLQRGGAPPTRQGHARQTADPDRHPAPPPPEAQGP